MSALFALVDCNNFFVSCERLFRPDLIDRPVVVLSSNDGCVVSRSNQAKALGIPMGAPAFKYRQLFKDQGIVQFSANFDLYGDISNRITRSLTKITPRTEVYSVDESFLDLSELEITDYTNWGHHTRKRLFKDVGIPVAIGIAPTKTLAKLATERSKKDPEHDNVLDLSGLSQVERQAYLLKTPIKDVWGVGWRLNPKLRAEGINNALDLSHMRPQFAQQLMGIHGRRMVSELNAQACLGIEPFGRVRQSIMHGRMFGEDTNQLSVIEAAIANLTARAATQLRSDRLLAKLAVLQLSTNRHHPGYQRFSRTVYFDTPSADSGLITSQLVKTLEKSFNPNTWYHRANVLLYDLVSEDRVQADFFGEVNLKELANSRAKLAAFDSINKRFGRATIRLAAEDLSNSWRPKRALRSPSYTTDWNDLPIIKA